MIFAGKGHIEMIRNGIKTQTRRTKRGYYQTEANRKKPHEIGYAVQRKRGVKAEPDIRIVMDRIWIEPCFKPSPYSPRNDRFAPISEDDVLREGGYTPEEYEKVFRELNPKWDGWSRWVFEFHVIKTEDEMLSMNKEEAIMEKCCFTCANYRKTCFHGPANLSNFTEEECKRSGPPFYRHIESKEMKNDRKQNC